MLALMSAKNEKGRNRVAFDSTDRYRMAIGLYAARNRSKNVAEVVHAALDAFLGKELKEADDILAKEAKAKGKADK